MERLQVNKLFLKHEKCEFETTQVEHLGVIISEGKVEIDSVKVAGVAEWPTPESKKELQQFLGFTNFYQCFIQGYSHIAQPLTKLTGKVEFEWEKEQEIFFQELQKIITQSPVLAMPDNSRPFWIEADSSDMATGAVLSQQSQVDEKWHLVAYQSKGLNEVAKNYEIHNQETLTIIWALEEWQHFLEGDQFPIEVWMDHKNLEYFQTSWKLNRRQARWSLYLSRFDFMLHHHSRKSMGKPDALF